MQCLPIPWCKCSHTVDLKPPTRTTKWATGWRGVRWPEPVDAKLAPAHSWFVAMPGQTFRKPMVVLNDTNFWLNSTLDWRPKWMETCKKCYGQKRKKRGGKKQKEEEKGEILQPAQNKRMQERWAPQHGAGGGVWAPKRWQGLLNNPWASGLPTGATAKCSV